MHRKAAGSRAIVSQTVDRPWINKIVRPVVAVGTGINAPKSSLTPSFRAKVVLLSYWGSCCPRCLPEA